MHALRFTLLEGYFIPSNNGFTVWVLGLVLGSGFWVLGFLFFFVLGLKFWISSFGVCGQGFGLRKGFGIGSCADKS